MDARRLSGRWVLVTGAGSGIGRATALALDRAGARTLAAVRKEADADALREEASERLEPLLLDVTDDGSVSGAAATASGLVGRSGLAGLVNNAGVGIVAPLEYQPLEEVRRTIDVNLVGAVAVTQALLPLIRTGSGRIVFIGSVGDRFTVPFGGALCATKAAIRSVAEALRLELDGSGVGVCVVRPGSISTPAVDLLPGQLERILDGLPSDGRAAYEERMRRFVRGAVARERAGSPPDAVARVVLEALTAPTLRPTYSAGSTSRALTLLPKLVPQRLRERLVERLAE